MSTISHRLIVRTVVTVGIILYGTTEQGIAAPASAVEVAGGSVLGIDQRQVVCQNLTTHKSVVIRNGAKSWNCKDAGLVVRPGDNVRQTIVGAATLNPTYEPTCTPTLKDPYIAKAI